MRPHRTHQKPTNEATSERDTSKGAANEDTSWQTDLTFTISGPDVLSIITSFLYFYLPGVNRQALYTWYCETYYGGDYDLLAQYANNIHMKILEVASLVIFGLLYYLQIPAVEKNKTNPHMPWPWLSEKKQRRDAHWELTKRSFTFFIGISIASAAMTVYLPGPVIRNRPEDIPEWYICAFQCIASTAMYDVFLYWSHRMQHLRMFYKYHKQHHEYKDADALTGPYSHPIDIIITLAPLAIPIYLFDMHLWTMWQFMIGAVTENIFKHCGYTFPGNYNPFVFMPLATDTDHRHEQHHRTGQFNYGGNWAVMDKLFGTYKYPDSLRPVVVQQTKPASKAD